MAIAQTLRANATGSKVEPTVKRMTGEAKAVTSQARCLARTSSATPRAAKAITLTRRTNAMKTDTSSVMSFSSCTKRASIGDSPAIPPVERPKASSGLVCPRKAVDRGPAHILAEADGCS